MGCLFSLLNTIQQQGPNTIIAGGFDTEFQDEQVNEYKLSDIEIERLRNRYQQCNYDSEFSLHSKKLEQVSFPMLASISALSADDRQSNTYSQIHHRRISSRLSEPKTEYSYLIRHYDTPYYAAAGSKKTSTLMKTLKRTGTGPQKPFCSDSEVNLSEIQSDTVDDQPVHIWTRRSTPIMFASSMKKPIHLRSYRRSKKSLQKLFSSDSEMNWSDIPSDTMEDQPWPRYVLRPSVNQRSYSSPRSQVGAQHAIDESGTHSPPSLRIGNNSGGWTDLQLSSRASIIWKPYPNIFLSSGSFKLAGTDVEQQNELPEGRTTFSGRPTTYDPNSRHLEPILNEDGHTSPHLTEGSDNVTPYRSQCKSRSQSQEYLDGGACSSRSQFDEFSLHSIEHGGNLIVCMQ